MADIELDKIHFTVNEYGDYTPRLVPLDINYPAAEDVRIGTDYGYEDQYTGTLSGSGGEVPDVPVIVITDNGDGTGAQVVVSGSSAGAINTVYTSTMNPATWVSRGNVTGNGTVSLDIDVGTHWVYCVSSLAGSAVITNIQTIRTTNSEFTGTGGRNYVVRPRARGQWAVIWLSSSSPWAYESLTIAAKQLGRQRNGH